jgi:hypothetical protein
MPMNEITKQKVNSIFNHLTDRLVNTYNRWQDEKEYENWNDYITFFQNIFESAKEECNMNNAVFVKAQKRPFGITYDFEGWRVILSVNSNEVKWKAKKFK